jgi:tetratricopeptide (TPR) repeat protein
MNEAVQQRIISLEKKVGKEARSPLFAQLANYYLETNRAQEALRICDAGLAHFPFYTTGHLIKGKALIALNMQAEARREFEFVLSFLPKNETVISLLDQIPPGTEESLSAPKELKKEIKDTAKPASQGNVYTIPSAVSTPSPGQDMDQFSNLDNRITSGPLQGSINNTMTEAPKASSFFDAITQTPAPIPNVQAVEDPFGFGIKTPTAEEHPGIPEPSSLSVFDTGAIFPTAAPEAITPLTEQFGGSAYIEMKQPEVSVPVPTAPIEEISFEEYAAKKRAELTGEESFTLEDYFNNAIPEAVQPESLPAVQMQEELPQEKSFFTPVAEIEFPAQAPKNEIMEEPPAEAPPVFQIPAIEEKTEEPPPAPPPLIELPEIQPQAPAPSLLMELPETQPQTPAPFISFDMPATPEPPTAEFKMDLPQESAPFIPPNTSPESDQIEELAAKLQTAKRITPEIDITPVINIVEKESPPPSQQDTTPIGFVTPTLAEIYAKQGWFDDAIKAYRTLVRTKPAEKERFEKRIAELEELKKQSGK